MTANVRTLIRPRRAAIIKTRGSPKIIRSLAPRGLQFCVPLASPAFEDPASGVTPTLSGAPTLGNSYRGRGLSFVGGTECVAYPLQTGKQPATAFSLEVLIYLIGFNSNGSLCGWNDSSAGTSTTMDRGIYGGGGGFHFAVFNNILTDFGVSNVTSSLRHLIGTCDTSGNVVTYTDGKQNATNSGAAPRADYSTPYFCVGIGSNQFGNNTQSNAIVLLANFATVAWTAAEVQARYVNPFGFLQWPEDRRQYLVGTGGAPPATKKPRTLPMMGAELQTPTLLLALGAGLHRALRRNSVTTRRAFWKGE